MAKGNRASVIQSAVHVAAWLQVKTNRKPFNAAHTMLKPKCSSVWIEFWMLINHLDFVFPWEQKNMPLIALIDFSKNRVRLIYLFKINAEIPFVKVFIAFKFLAGKTSLKGKPKVPALFVQLFPAFSFHVGQAARPSTNMCLLHVAAVGLLYTLCITWLLSLIRGHNHSHPLFAFWTQHCSTNSKSGYN